MTAHRNRKRREREVVDEATGLYSQGLGAVWGHPLFGPLLGRAFVNRHKESPVPPDGWILVTARGVVEAHPTRRAEPAEWTYAIAHGLLHLGFGHFDAARDRRPIEWTAACCAVVTRFLADLKLGRQPEDFGFLSGSGSSQTEDVLYRRYCRDGVPPHARLCMPRGLRPDEADPSTKWLPRHARAFGSIQEPSWEDLFGEGLALAVADAVDQVAGGHEYVRGQRPNTLAQRARSWFVNSYPLLGALAAHFDIVEDREVCRRLDIAVAAVDEEAREIYVNPMAGLNEPECRFVVAHELLHVGLRHAARCQGRDAYLWNVCCDFVINGWLVEMGIGDVPSVGGLYDPTLKGQSAEAIYDRLVTDMRRARKLATLRGEGLGDMLHGTPDPGASLTLDDLVRRALCQGLVYHQEQGRGLLPAGLVEEIRALAQPPIPWDVELAQWFAHYFPPVEKTRSYARPSRRQSATPDVPRPRWVPPPPSQMGRTFGVVLDTSGSMDRKLLARALGAIASYSLARDVPAARVVFCDAVAYDAGYLPPEAILDRVRVKGRGGTVLQPGIDLLERAADFPKTGPILVITDGYCDVLRARRDHAFLVPQGHSLPFPPKGPVFCVR